MPFPLSVLTNCNPIVRGLYTQAYDQGGDFPPPTTNFWVETVSESQMVTPDGDKYIFVVE